MNIMKLFTNSFSLKSIKPLCGLFSTSNYLLSDREQRKKQITKKKLKKYEKQQQQMELKDYYLLRNLLIDKRKAIGRSPYNNDFYFSINLYEFIEKYQNLNDGEHHSDIVSVVGRVQAERESESKLTFYDLENDEVKIQVVASAKQYSEATDNIKIGDIIKCTGHPGKTRKGELSIIPQSINLLTPCFYPLVRHGYGLKNKETGLRQRYLDLLANKGTMNNFKTKHWIILYLHIFFYDMEFLELETLIQNPIPGAATAKPFITNNDYLFMGISPETYLEISQIMVVGGINRVCQIDRQFRNEGINLTNKPEIPNCEFYMAYADHNDLMKITEALLSGLVQSITGLYKLSYHPDGPHGEEWVADFTLPFKKIDMLTELEKELGCKIPAADELHTPEANSLLDKIAVAKGVECPDPRTTAMLLDKLVGEFLVSKCISPTFIINYPEIMSPLAKWHRSIPGLTERSQLYVCKLKICNIYSVLNDPVVQRERFKQQFKAMGDDEAKYGLPPSAGCGLGIDPVVQRERFKQQVKAMGDDEAKYAETFCEVLEYGLPPSAGCGLGIDRLAMLLTDKNDIKEVITATEHELQKKKDDKGAPNAVVRDNRI